MRGTELAVAAAGCGIYTAWAVTHVPQLLAAEDASQMWAAVRLPLWTLLAALYGLHYYSATWPADPGAAQPAALQPAHDTAATGAVSATRTEGFTVDSRVAAASRTADGRCAALISCGRRKGQSARLVG